MKRDTNEIGRTMQLDCLVLIKLLYAIDPIKQKTTTKKRKREMLRVRIKAKSLFNPCFSMYLERGQLQLHNWEIFFQMINPVVGRKRPSKINTHTHTRTISYPCKNKTGTRDEHGFWYATVSGGLATTTGVERRRCEESAGPTIPHSRCRYCALFPGEAHEGKETTDG
jgi:hypothetical protein